MSAESSASGWLAIGRGARIARDAISIRAETSGGPGGQHANRARTRIVATLHLADVTSLRPNDRARLVEELGPVVRSSASRFRSQGQNRDAALEQMRLRLAAALIPPETRRATRPTTASRIRRVDDKRARGRQKRIRQSAEDD